MIPIGSGSGFGGCGMHMAVVFGTRGKLPFKAIGQVFLQSHCEIDFVQELVSKELFQVLWVVVS